jgi:hypothetical protein
VEGAEGRRRRRRRSRSRSRSRSVASVQPELWRIVPTALGELRTVVFVLAPDLKFWFCCIRCISLSSGSVAHLSSALHQLTQLSRGFKRGVVLGERRDFCLPHLQIFAEISPSGALSSITASYVADSASASEQRGAKTKTIF